ncbi:uncharacterized protein N7459_002803 [Penicillium hispanicum]|uniref:uncharacterized protein n=1 Tax=Penicillium hispanicum TaxID=1080232 RepID=UPI00253F8E66|nr:uncharacterized protein N7459_002803 [Penicillium hispanicum]KAJ5587038.1 hypothetical protein N7459_002803 [Penicillium hispanicum]
MTRGKGTCRFKNCRYAHIPEGEPPNSMNQTISKRNNKRNEFDELSSWKRQASNSQITRPLGSELGPFFKRARSLIEIDEGILQDVIRCLSQEGGLKRIQELIERDFSVLSVNVKRGIFQDQIFPFMEIITFPNVLGSLVLEQAVVTIYNCIFGPAGLRGEPFLRFLMDEVQLEIESKGTAATTCLELSLLVFSQVVELNSTAFVQEPLKLIAQRFADLFLALHALDTAAPVHQSCQYLERLQRRLDVGLSLPKLSATPTQLPTSQAPVEFVTQQDPPGGRHDNDHADICNIKIMPTFQEIMSPRSEYIPVKDPRQWHVTGLAGLLDRNFRLLREDTIGQLRDVIHAELQPSTIQGTLQSQKRTHVYKRAIIQGMDFHRFSGLRFLVKFAQPANVRAMSKNQRKEWWQLSKRLQPAALVCLVDPKGFAIFCIVATPDNPEPRSNAAVNRPPKLTGSLADDPMMASVLLELVESTEVNWQCILDCHTSRREQSSVSLVEFPGILLPSFQPTLLALQQMQKTAGMPMSEFLAPRDIASLSVLDEVPSPVYVAAPGFSFNLQCLMEDGSSLRVQHSQPVDLEKLQKHSTLDDAQAVALVRTLQRQIGLIQGPPGTGKSFTGVALIKVLLANGRNVKNGLGPIICVCYTNHALDQLLEDLQENNVTSQIIRIGSQSKSELLQPLNLRTVVRKVEKTRLEKTDQFNLYTQLDSLEEVFHQLRLNSVGSDYSLKYFLQRYYPGPYRQLFEEDKDGFKRHPTWKPDRIMRSWLNGGQPSNSPPRAVDVLAKVHVDTMTAEERKNIYKYWTGKQKEILHSRVQSTLFSHLETKASWDMIRDELHLRCLRGADVIGVTTTGLARNLNMLRRLQTKVLLCEEAGEVLEAHLLTSLLPSLEQVILIGDHQQLRPQIQSYELSRESSRGQKYSMDRSLFERLVEPDEGVGIQIPFCTLETQRRMHPSISRLIRETLYPQLKDAPSVLEYPEVVGMRKRLFWLDHRHPEGGASSQDALATSYWNDHEIQLTVALVNHLIHQGVYQSGGIAVLTPYLGQLHRLRRKLSGAFTIALGERDQEDLDNAGFTGEETKPGKTTISRATLLQTLRVATVDNFQGEEAKVVVISLVRSNNQNRCGFLRTPNRINVLLSRAKHGMYIIGNSETSRGVEMWGKVLDILEKDGNLGSSLELSCPRHPETPIAVSEPEHFVQFSPEGGCSLQCGKRLECGHPCKQKCHSEMLHKAVYCLEACPRPRKGCTHLCPKLCGDKCPALCTVTVFDADRLLPCGHSMATLPCWQAQDLSTVVCRTSVKKQVPDCNHTVTVPCHIDVTGQDYQCTHICQAALACGHNCKRSCWACMIPLVDNLQVDHGPCKQKCGRLYSTCAHACSAECHGETPCPPCMAPCDVQCGHSRCPKKCSEPCAPCAVSQCLSSCPHSTCSMPCAAPCDHIPCSRRCEKLFPCGHQCPSVCGEFCPPESFCQICGSDKIKETPVDFILGESYREVNLDENPCMFPQCGHFLTVESMDAQMDLKKHYVMNEMEKPVSISSSSQPFSIDDIRTCATCRGSLRSLSRYGRLVRRALLDETTKKFYLYVNQQYLPLAQDLSLCLSELRSREGKAARLFQANVKIRIEGPPEHQVGLMSRHIHKYDKSRWKDPMALRKRIVDYKEKVKMEEQPFSQVRNMVEDARRRKRMTGQFDFDETVLETKGHLQAAALLLRLDTALLSDFLSLKKLVFVGANQSDLFINLSENRKESEKLINDARSWHRVMQQTEGNLFLAQLCALERQNVATPAHAECFLREGMKAIEEAQRLCKLYPGQTRGISEEIEGTRGMFCGKSFYTPVSSEERMAVLAAMAREFLGTGHWYYCENGHPFTIGECGGAVQLARCPECGSPVGGQNHHTAAGVTHADDLEEALRDMHI